MRYCGKSEGTADFLRMQDVQRYLRLEASSMNGFEGLPFFAAAVVAGNIAKLPHKTLNSLALTYVVSRVLYNILYDRVTSEKYSILRSIAYFGGASLGSLQ